MSCVCFFQHLGVRVDVVACVLALFAPVHLVACVCSRLAGRFKGEVVHWYEESDTYDVLYSGFNFFLFGFDWYEQ